MSTIFIKKFDDILDTLKQQGKASGNTRLDFYDVILDEDIQPIAEACKRLGMTTFTISARQSNIIDVLSAFQDLGITVQGMTKIQSVQFDEPRIIRAFLLEVQD